MEYWIYLKVRTDSLGVTLETVEQKIMPEFLAFPLSWCLLGWETQEKDWHLAFGLVSLPGTTPRIQGEQIVKDADLVLKEPGGKHKWSQLDGVSLAHCAGLEEWDVERRREDSV
jgi:hypothetical protein